MCCWKCFKYIMKSASCIHPVRLAVPIQPVGPSRTKWGLKWTCGKMNIGGMVFPIAFPVPAIVTSVPRSAEVRAPTCFSPRLATILSGVWTVVIPVSSTFQMFCGGNLFLSRTLLRLSKNFATFTRLKLVALDRLVGCGRLIERVVFLFMNPENQSSPAINVSLHCSGNLQP